MEWKNLFAKKILTRGREYFENGAVRNLRIKQGKITANVIGTENYEVEIDIDDNEISEIYCDCPYAEDGNYCKHMAAVLYAAENNGDVDDEPDIDINKLIDEAKPAQLRSFLKDAVSDSEDLAVRLQTYLTPKTGKINVAANKRLVDRIADNYTGYDSYISYYDAYNFIEEMEKILRHSVQPLIESGRYDEAFELLGYVFIKTAQTDMDDDGGLTMFGDECVGYWRDIISKASTEQNIRYFDWFEKHIDGSVVDYMEDYFINVLENFFNGKEFLKKKLEFTGKKAALISDLTNYHNEYEKERWALLHLGFMEKARASADDIFSYCKENWEHSKVRQYCVEKHISRKDIPAAIAVLKESLEMDKDAAGLVSSHRHKLKDLYKLQGDTGAYREQLWLLLTKSNAGVDEYRELKTLYSSEEWQNECEKIFGSNYHKPDFFREEKLWDRLLQYVKNSYGTFDLEKYESDLVKIYPQEVLQIYADDLRHSAKQAHSRNTYSRWAETLKHMKTIKGGTAVVTEILAEWRQVYKNRPAMMEELQGVDAKKLKPAPKRKLK